MKTIRLIINTLTTTIFIFTLAVAVQAQHRVFVSGAGDDANPCTRTLPCRNFQRGHDAVAVGGEVVAIDSAGYGPVNITKSVTITGDGVYAGITATSGNAVIINAAGITVNLRSLTIEGLGSGNFGVYAADFTVLHIESCTVNGFAIGIRAEPSAAGTRKLFIKDCIVRNNPTLGIYLVKGSGTAMIATIEGTRLEKNGHGMHSSGLGLIVTARGCLASGNSDYGFISFAGVLDIESSVVSNNGSSGIVGSGAIVRVSNTIVTNNTDFGLYNASGTFQSRGNNTVRGNNGGGAQTSGTITPLAGT